MTARKVLGWVTLLLGAALALGVWVGAVVLFGRPELKALLDVSPQARFSVQPATEELLARIREQGREVEFHTVFLPPSTIRGEGPQVQQARALQRTLQGLTVDLLRQYDYLGGDAVTVTHHDLMRRPDDVEAVMKAVANKQYNAVIVKLGKRTKLLSVDFDLAELDVPELPDGPMGQAQQRSVPTLAAYKGEEAISTALKQLLVEGEPIVYFLPGRQSTEAVATGYSELAGALTDDGFQLETLDLNDEARVPDDAAVVALLEPRGELTPTAAAALYRYLRRGGRMFANVPWSQIDTWNIELRGLSERLGFEIGPELVCHVIRDPSNPSRSTSGHPKCQNLLIRSMNPTHPITRPLMNQQRYPRFKLGREIRALSGEREGVRVDTSLLRTGQGAWLETPPIDWVSPGDRSAFASRSIGAVVDIDPEEGERPGHLVIVAGQGFENLSFEFNGDLALNTFNWLAEREELVSVRGSKYVSRKLEVEPWRIERLGQLLVFGVPGALLLLGLAVLWRRRSG